MEGFQVSGIRAVEDHRLLPTRQLRRRREEGARNRPRRTREGNRPRRRPTSRTPHPAPPRKLASNTITFQRSANKKLTADS